MNSLYLTLCMIFFSILVVDCWTDEDLELFDLVESTDRKFYDILGVDQKASASDIRKAYRKLSQIYHPDRNKAPNAEETFRQLAAVAEVLKNEEQRKKYDIILQTGLPDWREPVYYYRRVRNMGLFELVIFLFCLVTVGQYLFLWSSYFEKKYEMDELMSAKLKKKAKLQKKGKAAKTIAAEELEFSCDLVLPKPKWQDLFPVKLTYFLIHVIISLPHYAKSSFEVIKTFFQKKEEPESDEESEDETEIRIRPKKHTQHQTPHYPEFSEFQSFTSATNESNGNLTNGISNGKIHENGTKGSSYNTETAMMELKKAMRKFPQGTLQRWEKIASYLNYSVSEVVSMAKQMKSQDFAKNKLMLLELQGISGILKDNVTNSNSEESLDINGITHSATNRFKSVPNGSEILSDHLTSSHENYNGNTLEKIWRQEEQKALEVALQKFPKDTPARWDRIADAVPSKTKEECIIRYKELAQQIKKKKVKDN